MKFFLPVVALAAALCMPPLPANATGYGALANDHPELESYSFEVNPYSLESVPHHDAPEVASKSILAQQNCYIDPITGQIVCPQNLPQRTLRPTYRVLAQEPITVVSSSGACGCPDCTCEVCNCPGAQVAAMQTVTQQPMLYSTYYGYADSAGNPVAISGWKEGGYNGPIVRFLRKRVRMRRARLGGL